MWSSPKTFLFHVIWLNYQDGFVKPLELLIINKSLNYNSNRFLFQKERRNIRLNLFMYKSPQSKLWFQLFPQCKLWFQLCLRKLLHFIFSWNFFLSSFLSCFIYLRGHFLWNCLCICFKYTLNLAIRKKKKHVKVYFLLCNLQYNTYFLRFLSISLNLL